MKQELFELQLQETKRLKKNLLLKTGYISALFLIFYSIFRVFSEIFREPDSHLGYFFGYFSMGTLLSFLTLIAIFIVTVPATIMTSACLGELRGIIPIRIMS